jgi:outer membrane lipoprotein-sorting protein
MTQQVKRGIEVLFCALLVAALVCWRMMVVVTANRPQQILHQAITVGADTPMRADLLILRRRHGVMLTTQASVIQGGRDRYRMEYVLPTEARDRIVTSDGQTNWQYEPHRHIVAKTTLVPETEQNEQDIEDLIARNYRIALVSDQERIADRPAYLLELLPRQAGKSTQRRWIDRATFKTLRIETHYPDGILARVVSYDHITLPAKVSPADFLPPHTAGLQYVAAATPSDIYRTSDLADCAHSLGLSAEGALGFRLTQAAASPLAQKKTAQLLYSDGIETVSIFVQNGGKPAPGSPGWHAIRIGDLSAYENIDGHLDAIVWAQGSHRYTAVSHLGPKALYQFIASQVHPTP